MSCVAMCSRHPACCASGAISRVHSSIEVLVDVGLLRIGDVRRLEIGALHDADRGAERDSDSTSLRGAIEVGLHRDADPRRLRARAAEQIERRIDVGRALHVDPQEVAALLGPLDQPIEVRSHSAAIEIEPELRRLDRDVRVEPGGGDLVQHVEVVLRDLLGFLRAREVLAEARQDGGDALAASARCAARSASSILSPGMNRDTDLRTNAALVARSRSQALVEPASRTFRITLIRQTIGWSGPARSGTSAPSREHDAGHS